MTVLVYDIVYVNETNKLPFERVIRVSQNKWNTENRHDIVSEQLGTRVHSFKYSLLD